MPFLNSSVHVYLQRGGVTYHRHSQNPHSNSPITHTHPQTKCHRYWPEPGESVMYGDISVQPVSEKAKEDWTVREFKVSQV